jgi:hypothetical protein
MCFFTSFFFLLYIYFSIYCYCDFFLFSELAADGVAINALTLSLELSQSTTTEAQITLFLPFLSHVDNYFYHHEYNLSSPQGLSELLPPRPNSYSTAREPITLEASDDIFSLEYIGSLGVVRIDSLTGFHAGVVTISMRNLTGFYVNEQGKEKVTYYSIQNKNIWNFFFLL